VLERNGFRREGFARRLLKINGVWEDHVLHALLNDDAPSEFSEAHSA
jgi:ribosomal-protein-alanine N-acetyltransferase